MLANPLGADVMLNSHHVSAAMFGNPSVRFQVDSAMGGLVAGTAMHMALEDYGVFRSAAVHGDQTVGWENRFPYMSAVAVVQERSYSMDWREEIIQRIPLADQSIDAATRAALRALNEINAAVAAGEEPDGAISGWTSMNATARRRSRCRAPGSMANATAGSEFLKTEAYDMLAGAQG